LARQRTFPLEGVALRVEVGDLQLTGLRRMHISTGSVSIQESVAPERAPSLIEASAEAQISFGSGSPASRASEPGSVECGVA